MLARLLWVVRLTAPRAPVERIPLWKVPRNAPIALPGVPVSTCLQRPSCARTALTASWVAQYAPPATPGRTALKGRPHASRVP